MLLSAVSLVLSPVGNVVALAEDPPTTSSPSDPTDATTVPTSDAPTSSEPSAPPDSSAPDSSAPDSSAPDSSAPDSSAPEPPSATSDPTTTTTDEPTTSASPRQLGVWAILGAPNPFDATHGFTLLARHDGQLRGGSTVGAVAVGGDLSFGPYKVTPTPAAALDEAAVGVLVGGAIGLGDSTGRLTVGANADVLIGKVGAVNTVPIDRGVAVVPAGADGDTDPQIRTAGPQDVATVASPGTFDGAFHGTFADLARRARVLAATPATITPENADGTAVDNVAGEDIWLVAEEGTGPSVWSVSARDLARVRSITIDPAPTTARPLLINVDGGGTTVRLDTPVDVAAAADENVLWNVVDAQSIVVAKPLAGSLLAPAAPVEIDADVSGAVVADSVEQNAGTVGGSPFAAELPKAIDAPTTSPSSSAPETPADSGLGVTDPAGPAGAEAVPPATGNNAVITVKVGGDRTSTSAVDSLAGVTLQLYDGTSSGPTTPAAGGFTTCISDLDGDCSFTVPDTQSGGANRDRQFWVVRTATPAGWFGLNALVTGGSTFTSTPYQFRTGNQLRRTNTYASSGPNATFMLATGDTNATASGGIWQSSRNNPSFPAACGLRVALVLDVSGSVSSSLPSLKTAAKTFTNSLVGTPSQLALFTFASTAPANSTNNQNRPVTPVSTQTGADTVNAWIDGLTSGGSTNWDRGIYQVAQSGSTFDIAVIITDGNPTYYGNQEGPGNFTRFREIENGIFSANAVKAEGTRMIAVGVGSGVSGPAANLISISGPTAGSDYYQTTDYTQAGAALRALALGNCQGTVSVIKQVVPSTAPPGSTTGAVPAGGWQFGATTTTSGVAITPTSGSTAAGSGAVSFDLTFPGGTTTAAVTVNETQQPGFTLVQQSGFNATCRRLDTNAALSVANSGATGFLLTAASAYPVSCTVYNRAPSPGATVVVDKKWIINGQTFNEGAQPPDFQAALTIGGSAQGWGVVRTGFQQGNSTVLNETVQLSRLQCNLVSSLVTLANGTTVSSTLPFTATLAGGDNSYTITNTVTCTSRLTLAKTVHGTAPATGWTLTATAPAGSLPGPSGMTGVTADVTAGSRYVLSESGGDPRYLQRADPAAVPIPGSTVSWSCVEVDAAGNVVPGFADGLNGGVTMPIGTFVRCTATNETATLVLAKAVTNDNGGTALPSDWQLTATPLAPVAPGITPVTVTGSIAGVAFEVRPGQAYLLTEVGPAGYTLASIECRVDTTAPRGTSTLTLNANEIGVCTFTNDDQPASLTLVKQVDNGTTGATATPADWTLSASGPTPISGPSGTTTVTNAPVNAGVYTLSESGGPAGYTPSAWTCTGATVTGSNVTVPSGGAVTCTITNTAIEPRLTLVKQVDNGTTGAAATPTDWTLAAAGPTPLSGQSGSPAVTNVAVKVGSYTLSESGGPAGYTPSTWSCTGATATATTVTLAAGQQATCTIVNTAVAPRLTLVKQVVNVSGGTALPSAWLLSAAGTVTIQGRVGDASVTDAVVPVGAYTLAESGGPAGYTASPWSCTGASAADPGAGTVTLAAGDRATCTIVNTDQAATLTLAKVVDPLASGSGKVPADWTLTATPVAITGQTPVSGNGDPTSPGGVNAVSVFSGSYDLSETGPAGFTPGTWVCQGGVVTVARVVVPPGGAVQCSITNTAVSPTLTLVKVVDNGTTGATAVPTDWTLSAAGPTPISGTTGAASVTDAAVQVGTYTLSESGPPGYTPSAWVCTGGTAPTATTVTLGEGQTATCTITNTAVAPQLTLVKLVDNGGTGGTAVPTDWTLTASGPTTISGRSGEPAVTGATVSVGSYTLSEAGGPAGYQASTWTCAGGTPGTGTVSLAAGELATCTITNTAITPTLTLVKVVDNGTTGATAVPTDWNLAAAGPTPLSGVSGAPAVTAAPVQIGDYVLSESGGPAGYGASAWTCVGAPVTTGTVTIALGQAATCTITNTAIAPTLTLVKQVTNTAGGAAVPTDWLLSAAGAATIEGRVGDVAITNAVLPIGPYTLAESGGPGGYTASPWSCTGAAATDPAAATVTLGVGDRATCTITNVDQPATLTLVKVVDAAASGSGKVPADWTLTATPVAITGQNPVTGNGDPTSPGGVNAVTVFSGAYDLTEAGPAGFAPGSWVCEGGVVTDARVVVAPGGAVRCTITNTAVSPTLTLVKVVDNGTTGATAVPTDWTLSAAGPTPISGATGSPAVTAATVQIGAYTLAESGPTGYTPSAWVCTGAATSTATSVTLAEGEAATCTITNTAIAPTLTLVKVVDAAAAGGTAAVTDWTLTASGPTNLSGVSGSTAVTGATVSVGAYALAETGGPAGYTPSGWSCVGGTTVANTVTLSPGDQATCTITNTAVAPQLTLVKVVDNGTTGATTPATAWTLSGTGPVSISGASGSASVTAADVKVGQYTLGEAGPTGYTPSAWVCTGAASSTSSSVSLTEGQAATCTITNTAIAPKLTLVKTVVNTSGGAALPTDWILTATGPTTVTGRTGDAAITGAVVPSGQYQLAESGGDPGYQASAWVCTGNATPVTAGGALDLAVGEDVTCTITNTDRPATLTLAKVVDAAGSGSSKAPADWTVTATPVAITGQATVSGNGDPTSPGGVNAVSVLAGRYDLSESGPPGFTAGTWSCQGGVVSGAARVIVPVQGTVVCQITNQAVAPTLTLVKVVDNGATNATAVPTDWTLSASGPTPISGATGSAAVTNAAVQVGTYTLGESGPPGYTAGPWTCEGGTAVNGTITLVEQQAATCTIVNTAAPGVWELTKLANPPSGTTVDPGAIITYTLIAAHESGSPITGATAVDDLTKVLPYVTVNVPLPAGLTMVGNTMTWAIPPIPAGGSVTVSFSVTVRADAAGVTVFNVAAPTSPGGHCTPCQAEHAVRVTPVVPPTDPPVTPEPPQVSTSGINTAEPLRWAGILLMAGSVLLVASICRLPRARRPRPA